MDTGRPLIRNLPEALTPEQERVASHPREGRTTLCLNGVPGTGKTTALMARLAALLREGTRPHEILVLVPQRAQVDEYERLLAGLDAPTRGGVDVTTFYSMAQRVVALFWPAIA
jgi:superfamily I DNA/RNA helicase